MRSIELFKIELPNKSSVYIKQKQYSIFLGNDAKVYFSDFKDAKRFLAETNRFLNERLHELNFLYGNIFIEYRKVWFYFDDKQKTESHIIECFQTADNYFYRAGTKSHTINANVFTFNYVFGICKELRNSISLIAEVLRKHKFYSDLQRLLLFDRHIEQMENELSGYGKN